MTYQTQSVGNDLANIQQDNQAVSSKWNSLQATLGVNATGYPPAQYSQADVDSAIGAAQKQIDAANLTLQQTQKQATDYDREATQINQQAEAYAAGLKCSQ